MTNTTEHALGSLEARAHNLEVRMASMETKLDTVLATLNTARGGWRTLLLVGGTMASIVGILAAIAHSIHWSHS